MELSDVIENIEGDELSIEIPSPIISYDEYESDTDAKIISSMPKMSSPLSQLVYPSLFHPC